MNEKTISVNVDHAQLAAFGTRKLQPTTRDRIVNVCDGIRAMLVAKNAAYGDSATNPVRIFSKANTEEQILVRIDDKLSRLSRGSAAGEDVIRDLIGYLVLLLVVREASDGGQ